MHVILSGGRECEVFLTLVTGDSRGCEVEIERMFDALGQETFDPTDAAECEAAGVLHRVQFDDEITVRVRVGMRGRFA